MGQRIEAWGNDLYTGRKSYAIVKHRVRFYVAALLLCLIAVAFIVVNGLNLGIDFRGGSEFTVNNASSSSQQDAIDAVKSVVPDEEPKVSNVGSNSLRVQTGTLVDESQVNQVRDALATKYGVDASEVTNTVIGPTWGQSVTLKAFQGLVVFLIVCAIFMAIYFRSWTMAVAGIVALLHDLLITVGVYAIVGWEITPASMIGFLTILGYSMYDTVVVFDKVRENTKDVYDSNDATYAEQANHAINQTLVRSINTTVVALLPIGSILFIGAFVMKAGTLRDIALALFVGMAVGAYSSIFLATPFEVSLRGMQKKDVDHRYKVALHRGLEAVAAGQDPHDNDRAPLVRLPGKRLPNQARRSSKAKRK